MRDPLKWRATPEHLLFLLDQKLISEDTWQRARELAGHVPAAKHWSRFLDRLLMLLGAAFLLSGIVFFFAYNWGRMSHFAEFAVLEGALVVVIAFVAHEGTRVLSGRVALMGAAILVGVLIGNIGTVYNMQADAPEFFLVWAVLIVGWVVVGEWGPLWLLLMALLNLTVATYWTGYLMLSILTGLNMAALAFWEFGDWWESDRTVNWMAARWIPRVLAVVAVVASVYLILVFIYASFESSESGQGLWLVWSWLIYGGLMIGLVRGYYWIKPDVFMLTLCGISAIVVSVALIIKVWPWKHDIVFGPLIIGVVVIGETAMLVQRLARLHREWERLS